MDCRRHRSVVALSYPDPPFSQKTLRLLLSVSMLDRQYMRSIDCLSPGVSPGSPFDLACSVRYDHRKTVVRPWNRSICPSIYALSGYLLFRTSRFHIYDGSRQCLTSLQRDTSSIRRTRHCRNTPALHTLLANRSTHHRSFLAGTTDYTTHLCPVLLSRLYLLVTPLIPACDCSPYLYAGAKKARKQVNLALLCFVCNPRSRMFERMDSLSSDSLLFGLDVEIRSECCDFLTTAC